MILNNSSNEYFSEIKAIKIKKFLIEMEKKLVETTKTSIIFKILSERWIKN